MDEIEETPIKNKKQKVANIQPIIRYRLCMYTTTGILRPEIPQGIFLDIHRRYGNLLRAIPSDRFITIDEIQENYQLLTTRLKLEQHYDTAQIINIMIELITSGLVEQR